MGKNGVLTPGDNPLNVGAMNAVTDSYNLNNTRKRVHCRQT